jgi:orotate phosphoribosyltransferase
LPFSPARYSRYKYGSVSAAETFAQALAAAFCQRHPELAFAPGLLIPWAKSVAERLDLPLAYVRAEAREPGGPLVECSPRTGARAVVIEDVVASGGSAARAVRALLAETSLRVAGIQSIANWDFPEMNDLLAPWTIRAVTSYPQVLTSAREAGMLSEADIGQLRQFYADPRRYRWHSSPADRAFLSWPV